ncbi:MAG: Rieske 2Fe-2S domain-containing protein [Wenzhouxiangellaceae bacterium]|nr:Rieske 2Fe-2S domain-containing protein [Wenzhouxiangellaceae bacterium]
MPTPTEAADNRFILDARELSEGQFREAEINNQGSTRWLVLTRNKGRVRAWLNVCPHAGRALNWAPDKFLTDPSGNLVCSAHGAVFEPERGECLSGPCRGAALTAVAVEERDGVIRVSSGDPA